MTRSFWLSVLVLLFSLILGGCMHGLRITQCIEPAMKVNRWDPPVTTTLVDNGYLTVTKKMVPRGSVRRCGEQSIDPNWPKGRTHLTVGKIRQYNYYNERIAKISRGQPHHHHKAKKRR